MRVASLRSPGRLTNGIRLRQEVCNAISSVEVRGAHGTANQAQADLVAFLADAGFKASSARRVAAPVPNPVPFAYSGSAFSAIVEFPVGLNPLLVPGNAQFVITGRTVSSVVVSGNRLIIGVTAALAAAFTVAYTDPGSGNRLRDMSGNLVANFSLTGGVLRTTQD